MSGLSQIRVLFVVFACFAGLSGSCGGQASGRAGTPHSDGDSAPSATSHELVEARQAKSAAEALVAPAIPSDLDRPRASEFVRGPLLDWVKARTAKSEAAAFAYSPVIAPDSADELLGLLELGALWQTFGDQLKSTVTASVPQDFLLPEQKSAYLTALLDATRRPYDEAYDALQRCVARAERAGRNEAGAACQARLERLPDLVRAPAKAGINAEYADNSGPKRAAPERAKRPGSQPTPCVFAGSLESSGFKLLSERGTRTQVARVWRLDLTSLTLPEKEGEATRVNATWPLQGTYWLDASELPLVLRARQELVKDHVWLDAGTPLLVFAPEHGTALAMRPRAWSAGSAPLFSRRVSCSELGLSGSIEAKYPAQSPQISFSGLLELSAAPGKPTIAKLQLSHAISFDVLAQRGNWHRIAAQASVMQLPYSFDAWTSQAPAENAGQGMIGLLNEPNPSHVSTQPLQVFATPSVTAPSMTLAPEVWFQIGKPKVGFVPIRVWGVLGPEKDDLWIRQSDLLQRARPLAP